MREIKFRGLDIDGRWFYGNLAVLTENVKHLKQGHYISNKVGMPFAYQVRPETVGEYTGLKDKNNKEIYEGDIVLGLNRGMFADNVKQLVKYHNGCIMFGTWNAHEYFNRHQNIEIIGNIYDNPELLEK